MRISILVSLLVLSVGCGNSDFSATNPQFELSELINGGFPKSPNLQMTPGSTCKRGNTRRYPERVRYCNRDVSAETKQAIIKRYDEQLGYAIRTMPRTQFKIDHFVPLCAGGSNNEDNLWPQHESIYNLTDPLEPLVCEKMAEGSMTQAEVIRLVREIKVDPESAPERIESLR